MTMEMVHTAQGHTLATTRALTFSAEQRQMIRDSFANGASDEEFAVLMAVAEARSLNPLLRQVHFVARWDTQKSRNVWSTQVSIDGMRAIAQRTGLYAGQDEPEFIENEDGSLKCCKVRVYRRDWDRPAVGVAYFAEYVQTRWDKTTKKHIVSSFWSRMPHVMLAKCAEALAIRKAFPEDTSGLYTPEEMGQADNEPAEVVQPRKPTRVTVETPEGFAALGVEQPRRVLDAPAVARPVSVYAPGADPYAEPLREGDELPHDIRVRAREIAGQDCTAAEWQHAVTQAVAERLADAKRIAAEVNDLRAQASRAESLTALAGLWIAAKADVAGWDDRDEQARAWGAFKARAKELAHTVKALQAEIALHTQIAEWNAKHPVGTVVRYWRGLREGAPSGEGPTRLPAAEMCGHASVWISGCTGSIALSHVEVVDPQPPPTGTDGPSAPRSAANDAATTGHAAGDAAPADGASASIVDQIATAWSRSAPGITEHVGAITSAKHLEASARAHLGAISPELRLHAMHCYTARLRELLRREETDESGERVVTTLDQSVAFARVESWGREGPRVRVASKREAA